MTRDDARRLYPAWTDAQLDAFIRAKRVASLCTPHFARLLPMTPQQAEASTFAPRTLREAGYSS